jgi:hypothetical protein
MSTRKHSGTDAFFCEMKEWYYFYTEQISDMKVMDMATKKRMCANDLQPFRPVHPGELLKDELAYRHLSQKAFAKQIGLPYTAFNKILNGKRSVTIDFSMIMEGRIRHKFGFITANANRLQYASGAIGRQVE